MTAFVAALLGAVAGLGLLVMFRAVFGRDVEPLAAVGEAVGGHGIPASAANAPILAAPDGLTGARGVLGRLGARVVHVGGVTDVGRLNEQLRVLDRSLEQHGYEKLLGAVGGFTIPVIVGAFFYLSGTGTFVVWVLLASLVGGVAGFFYADLPLNEQVAARRKEFRHALSSYLDLVTILMAGGAGTESALEGAAEDGDGWAFAQIRTALRRANLTRTSPWEAFDRLGQELGVAELQELAASVSLAGSQGAKIKESLVAKADAMRTAQAAELEATSEQQTEKMLVPLVVMALGLTLFVGYAAVQSITSAGPGQTTATIEN